MSLKKTSLALAGFLICMASSFAQSPPNSDFENWSTYMTGTTTPYSYELPNQWRTTDSITLANSSGINHSVLKETGSVYSGSNALRLQSWSYYVGVTPFINGIPGCATNGDVFINLLAATITPVSGSPDTVLHAQLNGHYKYTAGGTGTDSGSIEVCLFKRNSSTGNRDTVASGKYFFTNQNSYTLFSMPLIQYGSGGVAPDSMLIWIQSSQRSPIGSGQTGSVLLVDSLFFSGVIGVREVPDAINSLVVFPVPANDELNIHLDLKKAIRTNFLILDVTGKKMLNHEMKSPDEKIDISGLSSGHYYYQLMDERGNPLSDGKFVVSK